MKPSYVPLDSPALDSPCPSAGSPDGAWWQVDIFAPNAAEAQQLQRKLQEELDKQGGDLSSGSASGKIAGHGQNGEYGITVHTMGAGSGDLRTGAVTQGCGEAAWCAPNCCATLDGGGHGPGTFNIFVDNAFTA